MNIKFEIDGNEIPKQDIKSASNRIKFTTTIDKNYLDEFRNLCKYLDSNMNDGIEVFIEMISNDKDLREPHITKVTCFPYYFRIFCFIDLVTYYLHRLKFR